MAAATTLALPATKVVPSVSKVLTTDLVTFRGRIYRKVVVGKGEEKITFLEPVDVEVHVNPASIGLGLLTAGVAVAGGALAAWWMGVGVGVLTESEKAELKRLIGEEEDAIARNEKELLKVEALMEAQREECFTFAHRVRVSRGVAEGQRVLNECLGKIDDSRQQILDDIIKREAELKNLRRKVAVPFKLERRKRFGENVFRIF